MIKNNKLFLLIVLLFSFLIRFYQAGEYPTLLWDEAAIGYNAYSLLETGKDEYGIPFPLIFKSFGDYKPGLYIYLTLPFIKLLGLNTLAVRLPSILLGTFLPLFLYFLIKEISPKAHKTALIALLLTAFNPYSIHFSRGAWETNILTVELVLASLFFFKFINRQSKKYLFFSSFIFGLSLFTYQGAKMISLFLIIILLLLNFNYIFKSNFKKYLLYFVFPLFLFSLPVISGLIFSKDSNRLSVVSLFSYPRSEEEKQLIISETSSFDYSLFHNHLLFFSQNFLLRYFNHFSPRFLAFEGDWQSPRHSAPYVGVMLYPSLLFLIIGLIFALSRPKLLKINFFFLLWFLVAPIPAALTRDTIQAVRSMSFSIPLLYFASLGIYVFLDKYRSRFFYFLILMAYLLSFIYYSDLYFNHLLKKSPDDYLYGYQQVMDYVIKNQANYKNIVISDFYGQAYIYYLFYSQYPPAAYQKQAQLIESTSLDTGRVEKIDNIKFTTPDYNVLKAQTSTLAIFNYNEIYRQDLDKSSLFSEFKALSPINNISTFYAYQN